MTTNAEQLFQLKAVDVAARHVQPSSSRGNPLSVQSVQTAHRFDILYSWLTGADPSSSAPVAEDAKYDLLAGSVMDLGCGQGDQTGALAAVHAANPDLYTKNGRPASIVGVDPAPPDYGAPYTLQQAQDVLSQAYPNLSFVLGKTAQEVLATLTVDTVMLSHSMWYFPSAHVLKETFIAIREAGVKHLLLAEWALSISHPDALPHLLAVLLQGQSPVQGGNVQLVLSPMQIKALAREAGWKVDREVTFAPAEKLQDGGWEVDIARDAAQEAAKMDCEGYATKQKLQQSVETTKNAMEEAVVRIGRVRCMDVWTALLSPI
ncbi:hypothetical protein PSEUBRA_003854 [Kalmanozyma brasiliensis GHG001]|uniref:Methyltransferase domain-containing protein n=1 Tax=Kalmanozyma brasiliensis (strain GHG001) TaxID=1365824 RepID=V5EWW4_KALBG|nr:uncharacterized protein PSEUBRA_003854 [Kalmanozyma brasiliensis GHG001]EST06854.1 hypothetical protein PSEUBRA_003854 [Kalmanozyma brasiliensis GHG001]